MSRFQRIRELARDVLIPLIAAMLGYQITMPPPQPPPAPPPVQPPGFIVIPPSPVPPAEIVPPITPPSNIDPVKATVRIRHGNAGCTATILSQRPGPGRYYVLTAAHCVRGARGLGTLTLSDGRSYPFSILRSNAQADVALLEITAPEGLPVAEIADGEPSVGTVVWHQGYGVDRPGNRENGLIAGPVDRNGQLPMTLSVSSGDSGSGIFRSDNGQLVSVVRCTGGGRTYGGGVIAIRRLLSTMSE